MLDARIIEQAYEEYIEAEIAPDGWHRDMNGILFVLQGGSVHSMEEDELSWIAGVRWMEARVG